MKKKLLVTAMLAGLGVASTSQAVFVNPDNTGQVLLFPYYTVQNNFRTSIHIVNTKNETKAVKVRILEGRNSQEVLDFNLYLSPYDVWAGAIVFDEAAGARIRSVDTSCIAPRQLGAAGEPFRNILFASEPDGSDPNRWRDGYVEVIEMGVLTSAQQQAWVKHGTDRVPANCGAIRSADFNGNVQVGAPTGGLFGSGHLIAVQDGIRTSYDATALDAFSNQPIWTPSASVRPSLQDVTPDVGEIFVGTSTGTQAIEFRPRAGREIDAVSAVLTEASIANEYTIDRRPNDADRDSKTDWVVTFPTKRFYVNTANPSPFQNRWQRRADGQWFEACHIVDFEYFDREEQGLAPGEGDFSPAPIIPGFALCNEVNTMTLYPEGSDVDEGRLFGAMSNATPALAVDDNFESGWLNITFGSDPATATGYLVGQPGTSPNGETLVIKGLPVIGFSAMSNSVPVDVAGLPNGALSNYLGHTDQKGNRVIGQGTGLDVESTIIDAMQPQNLITS